MDYQIATVYRPEDFAGYYNAFLRSKNKKILPRFLNIIAAVFTFVLFGTALLILSAAVVYYRDFRDTDALLNNIKVSLVILAIGILLFSVCSRRSGGKRSWKAYPYKGTEIVYQFMPDQFRVITSLSETTYSYSVITRFIEDGDRFYLFFVSNNGYILPKRDIHDSTEFCRYIEEATGLSADQIKKK